jgi:3-oxoacyl-[acyl-carrier protein] reductase
MANLTGKIAVVTGASRGIGAAIAKRLTSDGATVAITYSSSPSQANELVNSGGAALAIQADAADGTAVRNAIRTVAEKYGRLDILVNNAGILAMGPIDQVEDAAFERALSVNVRGTYYATQEASRHMGQGGRIIMIGSVNSDSIPFPGASVYGLTKGAIASFTRGLARDLGPKGITVNNIQPGPVNTDLNPADGPFAATLMNFLAAGRYGQPAEIGGLVSYLASEEAGYITGAQIKIDGGFDA